MLHEVQLTVFPADLLPPTSADGPMHASGSRWRLLLVLLAALALACRGEVDPITGQQSPSTGFPNYEPVPKTASQRRDKMSGRSQAQKGRKRMMAAMFGDEGEGGPKAGCVLTNARPAPKRPAPRRPHTAVATLAKHTAPPRAAGLSFRSWL